MGRPALALEDKRACRPSICIEDPFTSPTSTVSALPSPAKPRAHPAYRSPVLPKSQSLYSGDSDSSTPSSSMELAKASSQDREHQRPNRERESHGDTSGRDPEKDARDRVDSHHSSNPGTATRMTYEDDEEEVDEGRLLQEKKAVKILLFLSGPCVLLSAVNAAWACIAVVITLLSQPIRLCAKRPTIGQQLAGLLGPTLNLQLRRIYTPLPPYADEDGSYDSFKLFAGHMLSPFLSFIVMFAAWILAVYWLSSACVGDPAGQDKRDDGRETVLGLTKWWEKWLMRGVKNDL